MNDKTIIGFVFSKNYAAIKGARNCLIFRKKKKKTPN